MHYGIGRGSMPRRDLAILQASALDLIRTGSFDQAAASMSLASPLSV
jgi:hypothetical protein